MRALRLLIALALPSVGRAQQPPRSGEDLVHAMQARFVAVWPRRLAMVKEAAFTDGRRQLWYEAVHAPGLRRLDIAPLDSLNGLLFRAESLYRITRGTVADGRAFDHAQTILTYDVYLAPPEQTIGRLRRLGFDLSLVHEEPWQGCPAYVVGAREGDRDAPQFWIDRRGLYLVRLIEPRAEGSSQPPGPPLIQEVWLSGHRRQGGGWFPSQIAYFRNGRQFLRETARDRRTELALGPEDFLPRPWRLPPWADSALAH